MISKIYLFKAFWNIFVDYLQKFKKSKIDSTSKLTHNN